MPAKTVSNNNKKGNFWPEYIFYNDEKIFVAQKEPNFALYVAGIRSMNKKIYLNKDQVKRWHEAEEY